MNGILFLLLAVFLQSAPAPPTEPSISFYFTDDVVEEFGADAGPRWTAECVAGGEFASATGEYGPDARTGPEQRQAQAAKFDRREFVRIATGAWQRANAVLPHRSFRVCVELATADDLFTRDQMRGIRGAAAGYGKIILRIHPDANWQAVLPYVIAHELHHSYWAGHHFDAARPFTLADYLVLEGRADYFAASLFPFVAPWTVALDASAYEAAWRELSKHVNVTDWPTLQNAMFGSPQAGIPAWAGYTIGYRLVSERMARDPELDMKAMTAAPASEFIPGASR